MTPDDHGYQERKVDGLVSSVARLEERADTAKEDRGDLREYIGAVERRLDGRIEAIGKQCDDFHEEWRSAGKKAEGRRSERADELATENRAFRRQLLLALLAATVTMIVAVIGAASGLLQGVIS